MAFKSINQNKQMIENYYSFEKAQAIELPSFKDNIKLETFSEIDPFKKGLETYLLKNEALNSILIGTLLQAKDSTILSLGTCYQGFHLETAWMLTHDKVLILTEGTERSLQLLADHFSKQCQDIYRIRGATSSVNTFLRLTSLGIRKSMTQNIYQLDKMILQNQSLGLLKKAELSDITYLQSWIKEYIVEAKLDCADPILLLKKLIGEERLYLWESNGTILSMAACTAPTFTGIRINLVFTPKNYRGKGYASSCTAALGSHLLENGYKKCFIFTDQENHTANSIYKKIGFTLMGSYKECTLA
jgi:predicted GNAT family acetyltransferase